MSGGQRTAAARQRARTKRLAEAGLRRVVVIVPANRTEDIKRIACAMRESMAKPS